MKTSTVFAFVTNQPHCKQLIRAGRQIADEDALHVVSIQPTTASKSLEGIALELLYQHCAACGATMTVLYNDNPFQAALSFLKKHKIKHIVTGIPDSADPESFAIQIRRACPQVPCSIVTPSGTLYAALPLERSLSEPTFCLTPAAAFK